MTDTERIDWLERNYAAIHHIYNEWRVWGASSARAKTLRDAIDQARAKESSGSCPKST